MMKKANGNCKKVRCITTGVLYTSVKETAKANEVSCSAISYAIANGTKSKGNEYIFEHDMYRYVPRMGERISELSDENVVLRRKAEAYDKLMAEMEVVAREKERHEKAIAKAEEKVERLEARYEHRKEMTMKALEAERKAKEKLQKAIDELVQMNTNEN